MSQDNKKSMVMYQGDGSNNVFAVPMTKGKYGTISVAFVRRGLDNYEYNPTTWTLNDENTLLTWTGDVLNVGDYIVIERTTARKQPYEFPNNQKHIERSDDNLERQIQEVADAADRALKLDPTYSIDSDKMNPIEWLQTIVRCKDLTVRGLRFANNVLQYSKDDPEKPESEKTWYSLLNTDGITNVRVGTDTSYFEYSTDGGSNWKDVGEMIRHNGLQGRDEADCHPISAITDLQKNLDDKINKQQGAENAGKILKVDNDGNIIASSEAAGLASVNHDDTLEGAGTESIPLGISKTVLNEIAGKQPAGDYATNTALQQGLAGKANKATTLAGYGITDGATKTELNTKLSTVATDGKTITGNGTTADPLTVAKSGTGLDIGDIVYTTRTDNELSGKVECNGAQYNFADVNGGDNNVQALLESGALPSVSIAKFDAMVAEQGGCDSFGYDSGATYFKVPKKTPRILVRCQKPTADNNYTWYNLYADGWCEQGGNATVANADTDFTLPIEMSDANYTIVGGKQGVDTDSVGLNIEPSTTTQFKAGVAYRSALTRDFSWQVSGYANSAEYTPDKWDYQNVQVERPMVQLFNGATDEAVAKCTEVLSDVAGLKQATDGMIDYVVESQEPTEANGYTWYRLYKSCWVEQGGYVSYTGSWTGQHIDTVSLPVEFVNTDYRVIVGRTEPTLGQILTSVVRNKKTTSVVIGSYALAQSESVSSEWLAVGMSAQGSN